MEKLSKSRDNWERLSMFQVTEAERKTREINLLIDLQKYFYLLFLTVSPANVVRTRRELKMYHLHMGTIGG